MTVTFWYSVHAAFGDRVTARILIIIIIIIIIGLIIATTISLIFYSTLGYFLTEG